MKKVKNIKGRPWVDGYKVAPLVEGALSLYLSLRKNKKPVLVTLGEIHEVIGSKNSNQARKLLSSLKTAGFITYRRTNRGFLVEIL